MVNHPKTGATKQYSHSKKGCSTERKTIYTYLPSVKMKDKTSALGFLGETTRSDFVFILLVFHLVLVYPLAVENG